MTQDELTPRPGRVPVSDVRRTFRLFRRFTGSRKPYVAGVLLLTVEAGTAVLEPWPIAYLVDYLQGARPDLQGLGFLPCRWGCGIAVQCQELSRVVLADRSSAGDRLEDDHPCPRFGAR